MRLFSHTQNCNFII